MWVFFTEKCNAFLITQSFTHNDFFFQLQRNIAKIFYFILYVEAQSFNKKQLHIAKEFFGHERIFLVHVPVFTHSCFNDTVTKRQLVVNNVLAVPKIFFQLCKSYRY